MKSSRNALVLVAFALSLLLWTNGCEQAPAPPPQQTVKAPPPPPPPPPPDTPPPSVTPVVQRRPRHHPRRNQPPTRKTPARRKAKVGVGKKLSRMSKSLICFEFASLYCVQERLVFEVQIPHAMDLFKARKGEIPRATRSSWRRSSRPT